MAPYARTMAPRNECGEGQSDKIRRSCHGVSGNIVIDHWPFLIVYAVCLVRDPQHLVLSGSIFFTSVLRPLYLVIPGTSGEAVPYIALMSRDWFLR